MKIVVINYDELNKRPSKEQVISDLIKVYKEASSTCLEDMGSVLKDQIDSVISNQNNADISFMNTDLSNRNTLEKYVKKENPNLLISYNLAGFELSTLTDSVLYNLLDCRQFHLITKDNVPNEKYLEKLLSINLFIFRIMP